MLIENVERAAKRPIVPLVLPQESSQFAWVAGHSERNGQIDELPGRLFASVGGRS